MKKLAKLFAMVLAVGLVLILSSFAMAEEVVETPEPVEEEIVEIIEEPAPVEELPVEEPAPVEETPAEEPAPTIETVDVTEPEPNPEEIPVTEEVTEPAPVEDTEPAPEAGKGEKKHNDEVEILDEEVEEVADEEEVEEIEEVEEVEEVEEIEEVEPIEEVEMIDDEGEGEVEDIGDEEVPLAGGPAPSISVRTIGDLNHMRVGDTLRMEATLAGFENLNYRLQWQVKQNGEWSDVSDEDGPTLEVEITEQNAGCAWRLAAIAA